MPSPEENLVQKLPSEAVSFFAVFSRFEYALKRCRYVRGRKQNGDAEATWDAFAKKLGKQFFKEVRRSRKADNLILSPPKRQVVKDKHLTWDKADPVTDTQTLFGAVRRVRNNLFHGGKFPDGPVADTSRDAMLLRQAKWVLELALKKCPDLKGFLTSRPVSGVVLTFAAGPTHSVEFSWTLRELPARLAQQLLPDGCVVRIGIQFRAKTNGA